MKWSRWLTWLGVAIALGGVIIGVWLQTTVSSFPTQAAFHAQQRLDYAALGIEMIGAGALLAVAAQIMGMMQATRQHAPVPGVRVAEVSEP